MKNPKIVVCDSFWNAVKCNGRFCAKCIKNHHSGNIEEVEGKEEWTCYKCLKLCVCAACRRDKTKKMGVPKKKRGRPRKNPLPEVTAKEESEKKKKRGRPRIRDLTSTAVIIPKKLKSEEASVEIFEGFHSFNVLVEASLLVGLDQPSTSSDSNESDDKMLAPVYTENQHFDASPDTSEKVDDEILPNFSSLVASIPMTMVSSHFTK